MIEIRSLRKKDNLDDLISLSREFFEEYECYHENLFRIDELREGDIVGYFSQWLANDDGETFVALSAGRIVGYITVYVQTRPDYWKTKKVGTISGLMVQKAYRRRGVARRLLAQARAFFEQRTVSYFTVYTAVGNQGAIEFYAQSGLEPLYTTMVGKASSETG